MTSGEKVQYVMFLDVRDRYAQVLTIDQTRGLAVQT